VVPKAHAENLAAGTVSDAEHLMSVIYTIAPSILRAVGADGYNLGMNHGECAGQDVMHTHLHIMPRINGVPRSFTKTHPSKEELVATAETIRNEIAKR
jgi:histidine triad (HIT) family protein